jgi:hypothetical protein
MVTCSIETRVRALTAICLALIRSRVLAPIPLLFLFTAGCGSKPQDVTNDPAFGNFASVVGTWKTKVPLRLLQIQKEMYLVYGDQFIPRSRELPVLPVGTEIRIEHLIFKSTFETDFLDVMGSLVGGPYSGRIVNIDSRLFTRMHDPTGGESTPTQYYEVWHGPNDKKPNWAAAPDKLAQ